MLRKFTLNGNFHVAAAFGIGDVGNSGFAADVDSEFESNFADFGNRHTLESSQGVSRVGSDRSLNGLKGLRQLISRIRKHASAFRIVAFSGVSGNHHVRSWAGIFDRFDINGGSVFEGDWSELSHGYRIVAGQLQFNLEETYAQVREALLRKS